MEKLKPSARVLLLLPLLFQLAAVWSTEPFPSQDGPSHLDNVRAWLDWHRPESEILHQYYRVELKPYPNLGGQVLLAGLLVQFSPAVAEKLLITLYLLLLACGLYYLASAGGRISASLVWPGLALGLGFHLHMGFFNFCLSLGPALLLVGFWLRRGDTLRARGTLALALGTLTLYFTHFYSLVMAAAAIASTEMWRWLRPKPAGGEGSSAKSLPRLARLAAAWAVPIVLSAVFLGGGGGAGWAEPGEAIAHLLGFGFLVSFSAAEKWVAWLLAAAVWPGVLSLLWRRLRRERDGDDRLLVVGVVWLALSLAAPLYVGDAGFIPQRLAVYPVLGLVAWLASWRRPPRFLSVSLATVGLLATCALSGLAAFGYQRIRPAAEEMLSAATHLQPRSTLLTLVMDPYGTDDAGTPLALRVQPFRHLSGRLAAERHLVDLTNYQASTSHFPLRFLPPLDPWRHIGPEDGLEEIPPRVVFADYSRRTPGRVDFVLLLGADAMCQEQISLGRQEGAPPNEAAGGVAGNACRDIGRQLAVEFEPVYVSAPRGLARLYRNRDATR